MYYCYILCSLNPKYKNQTYIGFTDEPLHRIRQHNGIIKGGAKFTSKRKPWKLMLVVSNFPNKVLALKFEWAWQNPFKSTFTSEALKNVELPNNLSVKEKKQYYQSLEFKLKVLNILLKSRVYDKIFLYIYMFDEVEGLEKFDNLKLVEKVDEESFKEAQKKKVYKYTEIESETADDIQTISDKCIICDEKIANSEKDNISDEKGDNDNEEKSDESDSKDKKKTQILVACPYCKSKFHLLCLATSSLNNSNDIIALIPQETICVICTHSYKWSEWIENIPKDSH